MIVFDEASGAPVPYASVQLLNQDLDVVASRSADRLGRVDLTVAPGEIIVTASAPGWLTSSPLMVRAEAGTTLEHTIALRRLDEPGIERTSEPVADTGPGYLHGRVLDSDTRRPLPAAEVGVDGRDQRVAAGEDGRFRFGDLAPGEYLLRVGALGFAAATVPVTVDAGTAHYVTVPLRRDPIEVEGVTVTTRPRLSARILEPAYERMSRSLGGHFLGPEDLERRGAVPVAEALQGLLGVRVSGPRFHRRIRLRQCDPAVYMDGVRVARPGDDVSEFLALSARDIEIIEVYFGAATLPAEFAPGAMCAVAIWSKR